MNHNNFQTPKISHIERITSNWPAAILFWIYGQGQPYFIINKLRNNFLVIEIPFRDFYFLSIVHALSSSEIDGGRFLFAFSVFLICLPIFRKFIRAQFMNF